MNPNDTTTNDKCPHCKCQTKDPFGMGKTIHNVENCKINRELAKAMAEVESLKKELSDWDYGTRAKREQERAERAEAEVARLREYISKFVCVSPLEIERMEKVEANLRRAVEIAEKFKRHTWDVEYLDLKVELDAIKATINPETK